MRITSAEIVQLLLILAVVAAALVVYPSMPERMPSHWDASGAVNGYAPRAVGVFLLPGILAFVYAVFLLIPRIDPLRRNIVEFRRTYELFSSVVLLFLILLYIHTLLWSAGIQLNTNILMSLGLGGLFVMTGKLCEKAKRNFFIGIRTPWTLSSDSVWTKTHRLGGKLFVIAGVVSAAGALYPPAALWFILLPVVAVSIIVVVYSYVLYEREQQLPPHP